MRAWLCSLLLLLPLSSWAEPIYRWVAPDGSVHFSDQPHRGAEEVTLPPIQTYSLPPPRQVPGRQAPPVALARPYSRFAIVSPQPDQTLRSNNGVVDLRMEIAPALLADKGHKIVVDLDGVRREATGLELRFSNLTRGAHTVSASVIAPTGQVVISTSPVTFFVQRVHL